MDCAKATIAIRQELRDYVLKNNLKSLVIGISGGIDSCLVAALAKPVCDELNIPLLGLSLPTKTNKPDEIERANRTCKAFCTEYKEIYLDDMFLRLGVNINPQPFNQGGCHDKAEEENIKRQRDWKIRNGNIKARLRMIHLYNLASQYNGLVLSTDNYTEFMLGFWTIHGDVGDYGPIQELWKSEVYQLADWLADNEYKNSEEHRGILMYTSNSTATDGLGIHPAGDLGQILPNFVGSSKMGYDEVDNILKSYLNMHCANFTKKELELAQPVIQRHLNSEFKRLLPISIPRDLIIENLFPN